MIERISNGDVATDYHKKVYINLIKEKHSAQAISHFIQFLEEENQRKQLIH